MLVPLVDRAGRLHLLLTQRTPHLDDHAGQISFPGGRVEAGDADREATALRETAEEIGLARGAVTLLGRLPDYEIPSGFRITPVVGWVEPPFELKPDPFEVAGVFEAPLDFLIDPRNLERHSRQFEGLIRHFYAIPYGEYYIWGATAGMLVNLAEVLRRR